jgi:hypothetical protein
MLDLKALPVLRKNLDAFIRADPVSISFERQTKIDSGAGGFTKGLPTTLAPQQFRVVPFKRRLYDYTAGTAGGMIPVEQFALVGRIDVDIMRDDEFTIRGNRYRVKSIEPQTDEDRSKTDRVVAMLEAQIGDETAPVVV